MTKRKINFYPGLKKSQYPFTEFDIVCGVDEAGRGPLAPQIRAQALAWAIAECSHEEIDAINILQATMLAMRRAVEALHTLPTIALIDGNRSPVMAVRCHPIIEGDDKV